MLGELRKSITTRRWGSLGTSWEAGYQIFHLDLPPPILGTPQAATQNDPPPTSSCQSLLSPARAHFSMKTPPDPIAFNKLLVHWALLLVTGLSTLCLVSWVQILLPKDWKLLKERNCDIHIFTQSSAKYWKKMLYRNVLNWIECAFLPVQVTGWEEATSFSIIPCAGCWGQTWFLLPWSFQLSKTPINPQKWLDKWHYI